MEEKVPTSICTRWEIELAELILVGTRVAYQATGDAAGLFFHEITYLYIYQVYD